MLQVRAVFEHDLRNRIREVALLAARYKILYQRRGTVFFRDDEHARESSAVRGPADERNLQRRLELHVLRNANKNSRLQERRVERRQAVVVIAGVAREILPN